MTTMSSTSNRGLVPLLRRRPLTSFFVLAYVGTWLLWLPAIFWDLPRIAQLPAIAFGVTGSAMAMTGVVEGRVGLLRFLRRLVQWRVGLRWYAWVLLVVPFSGIAVAIVLTANADPVRALLPASLLLYGAAFAYRFYLGPLWEEAGWRGFALPRMQERSGPLLGTLLLGLLWGFWHLPLYLPRDIAALGVLRGFAAFGMFVTFSVALACIFTWTSNRTRGSLLLAILLHLSVNGTQTYVELLVANHIVTSDVGGALQDGLVIGLAVVALLIVAGTRGLLGYGGERRSPPA